MGTAKFLKTILKSLGGVFLGFEVAERQVFTVPTNPSLIETAVFMKINATKPRLSDKSPVAVEMVFHRNNISKIGDAVIVADTIDMIDVIGRPNSMNVEPRQSVCQVLDTVNAYSVVSNSLGGASDITGEARIPRNYAPIIALSRKPRKASGFRIVIKSLSNFLCGDVLSHNQGEYTKMKDLATFRTVEI